MRRVPAEWEKQRAVWIAWPHNRDTWPGRFEPIEERFGEFIKLIAQNTDVRVIGASELMPRRFRERFASRRVDWIDIPTDDCWVRDYGPTFVLDEDGEHQHLAIDWRYNAWGGKYPPWDRDEAAAEKMVRPSNWHHIRSSLCVEGGALEWDGSGRLLTTPDCLVTESRNPGRTREEIEATLSELCGAREIIWVEGGGLQGDDTDGHIDQLARWISPTKLVVAVCKESDPNFPALDANFRQLTRWAQTTVPRVTVHPLPIPPPRLIEKQRVPESYCNFLFLGPDRLLMPTFRSEKSDDTARATLAELLPQVEITPVDCHDLAWGLGALHCASRDEPAT